MVDVAQREVWWAELSEPVDSGPGLRRPIVVASVANPSLTGALDRRTLVERVRRLEERKLALIIRGVDIVLGP